MTVIANDFVPVNAFTTDSLFVGVGQRFDVTIDASKAVGNYWFNVTFGGSNLCGASNNPTPAAIFRYSGAPNSNPTDRGVVPTDKQCLDNLDFTPVITRSISTSNFNPNPSDTLPVTLETVGNPAVFVWKVNGSAINVDWNKPVAEFVMEGNTSYPTNENLISVDNANQARSLSLRVDQQHTNSLIIVGLLAYRERSKWRLQSASSNPSSRKETYHLDNLCD